MKLKDAGINFLVGQDYTTIEILDNTSSTTFCSVKLTPKQLSMALSRLGNTPCEVDVYSIGRIGKKMEHKKHEFEIPSDILYAKRSEVLCELIKETLPDGWESDNRFSSQDTFFSKDGKSFARTTIRRWVP